MSSPESKAYSRQPVYRDFAEPPVRILLQSTDKKCVWADQLLLVTNSTFFAGLFELPQQEHVSAKSDKSTVVVENESAKTTETESQEAVLAASSDLDKSKPDVSEPEQEANIGSPIDIDADSSDMSLFLNFMYLIDKLSGYVDPSTITIDLDEARAIWLLADEYDCAEMIIALRQRLAALARQQPWAVLELASELDDMDLARVAIASMTEKHLHDTTKGDAAGSTMWPQLSKLRLEWQIGFLRLVLPITASVYYPKNPQL